MYFTLSHAQANVTQFYGDATPNTPDDDHPGTQGPFTINGGNFGPNIAYGQARPIFTKQGAVIFIHKTDGRAARDDSNSGGTMTRRIGIVNIDVNGVFAPNRLGRDIFTFYLNENGILYPFGGTDVSIHESETHDTSARWDSAAAGDWRCIDNNNMGNGEGCTGRLIEEGYRMNY